MVMRTILRSILLFALFISQATAQVTASVDRNPIMSHETLTLTIESINPNSNASPDLSPLSKDFEVLNTGRSSQTQIINGDSSHRLKWEITLAPKQIGQFVIPPINIGAERTTPLNIEVLAAPKSGTPGQPVKDVEIQITVDERSPYVQQQVIYTVKLYINKAVDGSLTAPAADNLLVQQLGDDRQYEELVNGERYTIIERKYAVFPQQSGQLNIPGVLLDGTISTSRQSGFFGRRGQRIRLKGDDIVLNVQAPPSEFSGQWWLPSASLAIDEKWDVNPPTFTVGEAITRTIILQASGLTAQQLPELTIPNVGGLKFYPDQTNSSDEATTQGLMAVQISKAAIVPNQEGSFTLPAISIPWWNTKTNKMEVASLPARTINVAAASVDSTVQQGPLVSLPELELPTLPATSSAVNGTAAPVASINSGVASHWLWVAIAMTLLWLGTLVLYIRLRLQHTTITANTTKPAESDQQNASHARKQVITALKGGVTDAAKQQAIIQWAQCLYPEEKPTNMVAFADLLVANPPLAQALRLVDKAYFTGDKTDHWPALLPLIEQFVMPGKTKRADAQPHIDPLYPNK